MNLAYILSYPILSSIMHYDDEEEVGGDGGEGSLLERTRKIICISIPSHRSLVSSRLLSGEERQKQLAAAAAEEEEDKRSGWKLKGSYFPFTVLNEQGGRTGGSL